VEGLRTKQDYEFRVSAENRHGMSDPCEPSTPVTIPEARKRQTNYTGEGSGRGALAYEMELTEHAHRGEHAQTQG